jgi:eukaryotic-like serine/threonine-protein kinase
MARRAKFCPVLHEARKALLCTSCGADAGDHSRFCPSCGSSVTRSAERDDYIGRTVRGIYRVEQLIGEGGMGKVFRAHHVRLRKTVVLKVLRHTLLSDSRTVQRFEREATAAAKINHPNSISVLDFGETEDGALYIAMEYVDGRDLHQIVSDEWPLPEPRVVRIVAQVLSALADAHNSGVIHRDLKPENIMVEQRRGEPDFVKVLDFGIAKIQDAAGEEGPALTKAGFVCGTPEYMSPEQARGAALDARSDLYAVGVILYQLMTGLLPFESDSAVGFATKHLTEEPPPPTVRRPDARISPAMERLILRALSKDPNDRPATAEQFRAELLNLERERRTPARKVSAGSPATLRVATPLDQAETRISREPAWVEQTQRTVKRPKLEPAEAPGAVAFKVAAAALTVLALVLGGWYVWQFHLAPLRPAGPTPIAAVAVPEVPLYEREVAPDARNPPAALKLAREGDLAHESGDLTLAASRYEQAFARDPDPELSLKLGEVHLQQEDPATARAWWRRHLRDRAHSKARAYIQQSFPEL